MRARQALLALLAVVVATVASHAVRAETDLGGLLDALGVAVPPKADGRVRVAAHVERADDGQVLVVTFSPEGDAKLVADPGITVTALEAPGVRWRDIRELKVMLPGQGYFATPPAPRLPFEARPGTRVRARVDYAWCLVGWQCLFGDTVVEAEVTSPAG